MNLRLNILANYASQGYVILVGLLAVPLYLSILGPEAYGLVGFFAMLQVWFNLLDVGLSHTLARETARFRAGAISSADYRKVFRAIESVFVLLGVIGTLAFIAIAGYVAEHWLNAEILAIDAVKYSLIVMALCLGFRWACALYRGVLSGAERLVWLAGFNSAIATVRFLGVLPVIYFLSSTAQAFFIFQMIVAGFELLLLLAMAQRIVPSKQEGEEAKFDLKSLKPVLRFSLSMAFASAVWVLVTQTDKLLLSKLISMSDYGYFTLATLVGSSALLIVTPIAGALIPRLTSLVASQDEVGLAAAYHKATQIAAVMAGSVAITFVFFPYEVLWAWTGRADAAAKGAPILQLYAVGNLFLALTAFSSHLQVARGNLNLHLLGSLIFVTVLVPLTLWATAQHGALGAGWVWVGCNAAYFFLWVPVIHARVFSHSHWKWLGEDIVPPLTAAIVVAVVAGLVTSDAPSRLQGAVEMMLVGGMTLVMSAFAAPVFRQQVRLIVGKRSTPASHG